MRVKTIAGQWLDQYFKTIASSEEEYQALQAKLDTINIRKANKKNKHFLRPKPNMPNGQKAKKIQAIKHLKDKSGLSYTSLYHRARMRGIDINTLVQLPIDFAIKIVKTRPKKCKQLMNQIDFLRI